MTERVSQGADDPLASESVEDGSRYERESRDQDLGLILAKAGGWVWTPVVALVGPPADAVILFVDHWRRRILLLLAIASAGLVLAELASHWGNWQSVDWILITGFPVGLFVLYHSGGLHRRFNAMVRELARAEVLEVFLPGESQGPSLLRERERSRQKRLFTDRKVREARDQIIRHVSVVSLLTSVVFTVLAYRHKGPGAAEGSEAWLLFYCMTALKLLFAFIVGLRLGRIASYGIIMWTYPAISIVTKGRRYHLRLNPQPGHPDGVYGLKQIGDFWTFEAGALIPPLVYLLTWIAIMNADLETKVQSGLQASHGVFVAAALILIGLQVVALWLPMLSLRLVMGDVKFDLQARAVQKAREVAELRYTILHSEDKDRREAAVNRLGECIKAYEDLDQVPLWPISMATLRSHILQLWPIVGFIGIEQSDIMKTVVEFFRRL